MFQTTAPAAAQTREANSEQGQPGKRPGSCPRMPPPSHLLLSLLLLSLPPTSALRTPTNRRPNILLLVSDDARYEASMTPDTPLGSRFPYPLKNLGDRIIKPGVSFENAFANFPSCGPSRQSFLTGRLTDTLQIWNLKEFFRAKGTAPRSMPQFFKSRNYTTVSVGKVFHLDNDFGVDENLSWNMATLGEFGATDAKCKKTRRARFGSYFCPCTKDTCADRLISKTVVNLLPLLAKDHFDGDTPFFLAVGFRRPHLDWRVLDEYANSPEMTEAMATVHPDFDQPGVRDFPWAGGVPGVAYFQCATLNRRGEVRAKRLFVSPNTTLPGPFTRKMRHGYWRAMSYMDVNLGHVLDAVQKNGLWDETVMVFMSDHGWSLGERAFWCKQSLQDASLRVPLVFYVPWVHDNMPTTTPTTTYTRLRTPAELVDVYPTLVGLSEETLPEDGCAQGKDLSALVLGKREDDITSSSSVAFSTYPRCLPIEGPDMTLEYAEECTDLPSSRISFMGYSVRSPTWRYTEWRRWKGLSADWTPAGLYATELYDHTGDTGAPEVSKFENMNLAGRGLDVERSLRDTLRAKVMDPSYVAYSCGVPDLPPPTKPVVCTKLKAQSDCQANFKSMCDWFDGYGCQDTTFCGFTTKTWRKVPPVGASDDLSAWTPSYRGQPGCLQYSSRCLWKGKRCQQRGGGGGTGED